MRPFLFSAMSAGFIVGALGLAGCQDTPKIPTLAPYKMDIQQGNFVTQEMLAKLKPGMTPSQVRFILGTPLVIDAFHRDRWDYVYRYSKGGKLQEARRIVIVFKDDRLDRIEGDVVPSQPGNATDGGLTIDRAAPDGAAKPGPAMPGGAGAAGDAGKAQSAPATGADAAAKPTGDLTKPVPEKPAEEKKQAEEEKQDAERGFFERMFDRLGF